MEEEHRYWVLVSLDPADEIHVGWSWRRSRRTLRVHNKTQQLGINQTRLEGQQEAALSYSPEEWTSVSCCGRCASSPCSPQNKILHLECGKKNKPKKQNNSSTCWEHSRLRFFAADPPAAPLWGTSAENTQPCLLTMSFSVCLCVSVLVSRQVLLCEPGPAEKLSTVPGLWLPVSVQLTSSDLWTTSTRKKFWFIHFTKEPRGPCQFFKS